MGICAGEFREWVIKPCLDALGDYSPLAEQLLVATAAQESLLGQQCYCTQYQGLGPYRITKDKHRELWDSYLVNLPDLASRQRGLASQQQFLLDPERELITNLSYSTGIAWMIYRRALTNTPIDVKKTTDLKSLARLWATHFDNGTHTERNIEEFIERYRLLVKPYLYKKAA